MRENVSAAISIGLAKGPPESIFAGCEFSFSLRVDWRAGVIPAGAKYLIREGERTIQEGALTRMVSDDNVELLANAPEETGEHRWQIIVSAAQERDAERIEGSYLLVFAALPHAISLAVWDVPSLVVRGTRFDIKAGVKCAASCSLAGRTIGICDEAGKVVGHGSLADTPLTGTTGLYWTHIFLNAPRKLKLNAWTARLSPAELKPGHDVSGSRFSFMTVAEPQHAVSIKVTDKLTRASVANAQVRLGVYRAITNKKGVAKIVVPTGEFPLVVTRAGYEMFERKIQVSKRVRIEIGARALPEEDPFALWTA